jgi:hypothetical protein
MSDDLMTFGRVAAAGSSSGDENAVNPGVGELCDAAAPSRFAGQEI